MTNTNTPVTNTTSGVLSIDANGDVILVTDQTGGGGGGGSFGGAQNGCSTTTANVVELGNLLGGPSTASFSTDREVPQNNHGIIYTGDNTSDLYHIGGYGYYGSNARFSVENHISRGGYAESISAYADADNVTSNIGFYGHVQDKIGTSSPATENIGVAAYADGVGIQKGAYFRSQAASGSTSPAYGIDIYAATTSGATGNVYGVNVLAGTHGSAYTYGVHAEAMGSAVNYAGDFNAYNTPSATANCGVKGNGSDCPLNNYGGYFTGASGNNSSAVSYGIYSAGSGMISANTNTSYGIKSEASGNFGSFNYGANGVAGGNYATNYGTYGEAGGNGGENFGVYAKASGASSATNIGVYATAIHGYASVDWAGWFDGNVRIVGTNTAGSAPYALEVDGEAYSTINWTASDRRFKSNVKQLESTNDKLKKLSGYTYSFKTAEFRNKNFPETEQIGLIAQELKEVFPQLVNEGKDGYLAVNYQGMIPVLLEGYKGQQSQIEEQQAQIAKQQQQIDELKELVRSLAGGTQGKAAGNSTSNPAPNNTGNPSGSNTVNLSDKNVIVLNQNVPNPFAESTVITYNIPESFGKAQIIFSTTDGMVIKAIDITSSGNGSLNIFADDLSHGMYTYSLVIDGKTIDSKKMIKE